VPERSRDAFSDRCPATVSQEVGPYPHRNRELLCLPLLGQPVLVRYAAHSATTEQGSALASLFPMAILRISRAMDALPGVADEFHPGELMTDGRKPMTHVPF
jgi:hypothetical protein